MYLHIPTRSLCIMFALGSGRASRLALIIVVPVVDRAREYEVMRMW